MVQLHLMHVPGGTAQANTKIPHYQNNVQFKSYELLISGNFHLIFPDHDRLKLCISGDNCI